VTGTADAAVSRRYRQITHVAPVIAVTPSPTPAGTLTHRETRKDEARSTARKTPERSNDNDDRTRTGSGGHARYRHQGTGPARLGVDQAPLGQVHLPHDGSGIGSVDRHRRDLVGDGQRLCHHTPADEGAVRPVRPHPVRAGVRAAGVRRARGAGDQLRVRHRHDPHLAGGRAPPALRPSRQGGRARHHRHAAGAGGRRCCTPTRSARRWRRQGR
jgi:hypothetical protein